MRFLSKILITVFSIFAIGIVLEFTAINYLNKNFHQLFYPHLYQTDFAENDFQCSGKKRIAFDKQVADGYQKMKSETIVFAGLARDIENALPKTIARIEKTASFFKDYRVVIFENDSNDKTRDILKMWSQSNDKVILAECPGVKDCKLGEKSMYEIGARSMTRMQKMSIFRNFYLKVIKQEFSAFDYLMVIDMDMHGPWSNDGIAQTIAHKDWDGVFAYGLHSLPGTFASYLTMYDGLAYVGKDSSYDISKRPFYNYLKMNFIDLLGASTCGEFVPVKSSFSGLALYKMASIKDAWYSASRFCEHVAFHEQMAKEGHDKFYINPRLILLSGHQGPSNYLKFLLS